MNCRGGAENQARNPETQIMTEKGKKLEEKSTSGY